MRLGSLKFIGRRTLLAFPVLLGASFAAFSLLSLLPGDAATALSSPEATPEQIEQLRERLGLNRPFLVQYWDWLTHVLRGDLGTSLVSNESIFHDIMSRIPVTAELALIAYVLALAVAVPIATISAYRPNGVVDRLAAVLAMVAMSTPTFVLGLAAILLFAVKLQALPASGFVPISDGLGANLQTMILPGATMAFLLLGLYMRLLRSDLVDQMSQEYVVAARAKGGSRWHVLTRHALRNSSIGLITVLGTNVAGVIGHTVLLESIFNLPGIGGAFIAAINNRDITAVQGIVLALAVIVVLVNLVVDMLYSVLDPRIRYGHASA